MKRCHKCNKEKKLSEFTKASREASGYINFCKKCSCAAQAARRARIRESCPGPATITEKLCSACNTVKPLEAFSFSVTEKHGRQAACKECKAAYYKQWRTTRKKLPKPVKVKAVKVVEQVPVDPIGTTKSYYSMGRLVTKTLRKS